MGVSPVSSRVHTEGAPNAYSHSSTTFSEALAQARSTQVRDPEIAPPTKEPEGQLRWAAEQLEVLFARELLNSMRRTIPEGGLFPKSFASEMYEDMLWDEWAKTLVTSGTLGLSELIVTQLRG